MNNPDYIPKKDASFYYWLDNLVNYMEKYVTIWGIPQNAFDDLKVKATEFHEAYQAYMTWASRSPNDTFLKNQTRKAVVKTLRILIKSCVNFNPLIPAIDRSNMGLPIYKTTRTPVHVPGNSPACRVDSKKSSYLTVRFFQSGVGRRGKPDGVHGCEIHWVMSEAEPKSLAEYINTDFKTHSPFQFYFDENQRGKKIWFRLRWENTRGESGPWSDLKSAIIP
jgi:hypothetical protein